MKLGLTHWRRCVREGAGVIVLVLALGAPAVARAQGGAATPVPGAQDDRAEAAVERKARFTEAEQAIDAGDLAEGRRLLLDLWGESKTYDVAALLGYVEYHLQHYAEAARYTAYAIDNFPPKESSSSLEALQVDLKAAAAHVATVSVSVDPPSGDVFVDGTPVGSAPLAQPLFLDPGEHLIAVEQGGQRATRQLTASAGERYDVDLAPPAEPAPQPAAATSGGAGVVAPTAPGSPPVRDTIAEKPEWPYWATGAVALVGLGLGTGFSIAARTEKDNVASLQRQLDTFGGSNPCSSDQFSVVCGRLQDSISDQNRNRDIAAAGFITLGVGAAGLISYWLVPASAFGRASFSAGPGQAAVTYSGKF